MDTIEVNGLELAYLRAGAGRTTLVLVHGYPLDHTIWEELARLLEPDFDLLLPDLRGFGRSALAEGDFRVSDMAADLLGLLDGLGIKRAALCGHSMGGYVALAFARTWPERLAGLGLVASQAAADSAERKLGRYQSAEQVLRTGVEPVAKDMSGKLSPVARVQEFTRELIATQRPSALAGALRAMAEREETLAVLSDLKCPVAIVHGSADELIPPERAREMGAAQPEALLLELDGVGHMPMMEAAPQVAGALRHLKGA